MTSVGSLVDVLVKLVGNILKSLGASDRFHGGCLSLLGGVRELHKVVLEILGELVDVLTRSMTSQEGRKTTNHCILQFGGFDLSKSKVPEASEPRSWRHSLVLRLPRGLRVTLPDPRPSSDPPNRGGSGGRPFKDSKNN